MGGRAIASAGRLVVALLLLGVYMSKAQKIRPRELGVYPGELQTGLNNLITDVRGVRVAHVTLDEGSTVRTGATAILPHNGDIFRDKVRAGVFVGNGFGKLAGTTQIMELGEIETPIVLTNTLSVPTGARGVLEYTLDVSGAVGSVNPIVGETNDGALNNLWEFALTSDMIRDLCHDARIQPEFGNVEEGAVGAGRGTTCFGWKGGIGTSSRIVQISGIEYTVGVLVQTNYGGNLDIVGVPVHRYLRDRYPDVVSDPTEVDQGSVMIVIATDAPLSDRNLKRIAHRASLALGRTGSYMSNGSGDYFIAFTTSENSANEVTNNQITPIFQAVVEATEESVYNSLFMAETVSGNGSTRMKLPVDEILELLRFHNAIRPTKNGLGKTR